MDLEPQCQQPENCSKKTNPENTKKLKEERQTNENGPGHHF